MGGVKVDEFAQTLDSAGIRLAYGHEVPFDFNLESRAGSASSKVLAASNCLSIWPSAINGARTCRHLAGGGASYGNEAVMWGKETHLSHRGSWLGYQADLEFPGCSGHKAASNDLRPQPSR